MAAMDHDDPRVFLRELVLDPNSIVLSSLCDALESSQMLDQLDDFAVGLVAFFAHENSHDRLAEVIKDRLQKEIDSTLDHATLFRRNSLATKMVTAYLRATGGEWLRRTMGEAIHDICTNPVYETLEFELDPAKAKGNLFLEDNLKNLLEASERFLDYILNSVDTCPVCLRDLCRFIREGVQKKFPESELIAIGGFVFLRFLCPAIVSPETNGLIDKMPSARSRRSLILVSKVLQNAANGAISKKEPFMEPTADWVNEKFLFMCSYFDQLSSPYAAGESTARCPDELKVKKTQEQALKTIIKMLNANLHKIGKSLVASRADVDGENFDSSQCDKRGFLEKRGDAENVLNTLGLWRQRWFVLKGEYLYYFKSATDTQPAGSVFLSPDSLAEVEKAEEFSFKITTVNRTYSIRASTADEMEEWIAALHKNIARLIEEKRQEESSQAGSMASPRGTMSGSVSNAPGQSGAVGGGGIQRTSSSLAANAAANAPAFKEKKGYLNKKGSQGLTGWKKRYFIFKDNYLLYFKSPHESQPQGEILIDVQTEIKAETGSKTFAVRNPKQENGRVFLMQAENNKAMMEWITAIRECREFTTKQVQELQQQRAWDPNNKQKMQELVNLLSTGGLDIRNRTQGFKKYNNSFVGREVIDLMTSKLNVGRSEALVLAEAIQKFGFVRHVEKDGEPFRDGNELYIFCSGDEDQKVLREGFLYKTNNTGAWQKRYFTLKGGVLSYYRSSTDTQPAGFIPLQGTEIKVDDDETNAKLKGSYYGFQVVTRNRVYHLRADNERDVQQWAFALGNWDAPEKIAEQMKNEAPEKKGFLNKQADPGSKTFKQRWFHLKAGALYYYKTPQDRDPAGVIALDRCQCVAVDETEIGQKFAFKIVSKATSYVMCASSDKELSEWMNTVSICKDFDDATASPELKMFSKLTQILSQLDDEHQQADAGGKK